MRRQAICYVVAVGTLVAGEPARADMVDTSSMQTWEHCALCHNHDGISRTSKFPNLAGQTSAYLKKQLRDFREDRRANDGGMMNGGAASQFAPEKLFAAARYFASLPPPPPVESAAAPAVLARGRSLFEKGDAATGIPACSDCHGATAAAATGRPRLEAQHARYLKKQLRDFRDGERANDTGGPMRGVAARLGDADIDAVAEFLSAARRTAP